MIEQILALVRESGQRSVVENPAVPNEHNDAVMQEASSSIFSGLQGLMQSGGPSALTTLFNGVQSGNSANPGLQQFSGNIAGNLAQKFGLSSGAAQSVVASLIPMVLGKMMNRGGTPGSGSGFNITDLLSSFAGGGGGTNAPGGSGNIIGNLSGMSAKVGLDRDGDGDTDLNDLMRLFGK